MLLCSQAAGDQHPQQAHLLEQHGRGGPEAARQLPGSEGGEPGQCSGGRRSITSITGVVLIVMCPGRQRDDGGGAAGVV